VIRGRLLEIGLGAGERLRSPHGIAAERTK